MRLRFQEVERVVRARHGGGGSPTSLLGRLKNLQRLGLPGGANVGAGAPAEYGLEQLLELLLAFEMLEAGIPPARVAVLLCGAWPRLLGALLMAWARAKGNSASARLYIAIASNSLEEPVAAGDGAIGDRSDVVLLAEDAVLAWLRGEAEEGPPSLLLIDPGRVVLGVTAEVPALAIADAGHVDGAFAKLGGERLGGSHPRMWRLPAGR